MQSEIAAALRRFWHIVGQLGRAKFLYDTIITAIVSITAGTMAWIVGLGLIAVLIAVSVSFVLSLRSYLRESAGSSKTIATLAFMKNLLIDAAAPDAPALFSGVANMTFDRITLFLDYSSYFTGFGADSWSDRRRIKLTSFDPFEKGIRYEAEVFSRTLDADGKTVVLNWGNNTGNIEIITSDKYRARLAFAVSEKEQYLYFILVAPYLPNGQRIVTILNQDDFTFREEWGKEEH